jgi:phosphatidylglycerophosphate synthase
MSTHDAGTKLDQLYRRVTEPLAARIATWPGVTPNRVSLAAFLAGGVAAPLLIVAGKQRSAGIAFVASDLLDYLDGDVARAQGSSSARGDVLDGILDRYTDFLCIGAMSLVSAGLIGAKGSRPAAPIAAPSRRMAYVAGIAAMIGSLIPSYVQALATANGRRSTQSIGGRGTRNRVVFTGLLIRRPYWSLWTLAVLGNIASIHRATFVLSRRGEKDDTLALDFGDGTK